MSAIKPSDDGLDEFACAALRGEVPAWSLTVNPPAALAILEHASYHGIGPLLCEATSDTIAWLSWPEAVRKELAREYQALTALEMLRKRELEVLLQHFKAIDIKALLLKGTPLAYGLYPNPVLRTRTDTDLLIRPEDRAAAHKVLEQLGYHHPTAVTGKYVSTQALFLKREPGGLHAIDLHWQISNSQVFAQEFHFDALWVESQKIEALGDAARALSTVDALLHACLHRAAHIPHGEEDRLLWYYDMHLLTERFDETDWAAFAERATNKGMRAVCADALSRCVALLGTRIPERIMAILAASDARREISAGLLHGGGFNTAWIKYKSLPNWRARMTLLREQLLPPTSYMRARYGVDGKLPLARAYFRRLLGAPNKLRAQARPGKKG